MEYIFKFLDFYKKLVKIQFIRSKLHKASAYKGNSALLPYSLVFLKMEMKAFMGCDIDTIEYLLNQYYYELGKGKGYSFIAQ